MFVGYIPKPNPKLYFSFWGKLELILECNTPIQLHINHPKYENGLNLQPLPRRVFSSIKPICFLFWMLMPKNVLR